MAKKMTEEIRKCPFCGVDIQYWPNCSPSTCRDYYEAEWVLTKRKTKIWFHKSCYMKNTRGEINNGRVCS